LSPFRRRLGTRRRRERFEWTGAISVIPTTVAVNSLSASVLLTVAALEEWPRGSVRRILGQIFVSPATAPAAATGYGVFLGLQWEQSSSGAAFDPEANLDSNSWFWWNSCYPQIGGNAAADSNASRWVGYFRFDLDVRRAHRYSDFEQLLLMIKNSNSSGASIQFSYAFRILVAAGAK
jgi:hypothetical protein